MSGLESLQRPRQFPVMSVEIPCSLNRDDALSGCKRRPFPLFATERNAENREISLFSGGEPAETGSRQTASTASQAVNLTGVFRISWRLLTLSVPADLAGPSCAPERRDHFDAVTRRSPASISSSSSDHAVWKARSSEAAAGQRKPFRRRQGGPMPKGKIAVFWRTVETSASTASTP